MVPVEIRDVVLDWLRSGKDDANDIVDLPWEVKQLEPNLYVADHPKMPFTLLLSFGEGFIRLLAPMGLETFSMTKDEKLKVYHALLRLNAEINLMKFLLMGMNDDVYLAVDLDTSNLGKAEFNDALSALLVGLLSAVSALNLEEEFEALLKERVLAMVYERLRKGASREELLDFLVSRVGMPENEALTLLAEVLPEEQDRGYL
ncbi:DNA-binding protein [Thermococcus sp. 9N3]|uniref:DNA-binding protein n=1 Tax=Thermococcus sp. 9N3 TaxID=163002 RepID=UPI00143074EF|nr:DNA-binding protein [Thermococcus sp. 9N3]